VLSLDGFRYEKCKIYFTVYKVLPSALERLVTFTVKPSELEFTQPEKSASSEFARRRCHHLLSPRRYTAVEFKQDGKHIEMLYTAKKIHRGKKGILPVVNKTYASLLE